jgi:predicted RNA-binding protein with RPS1 domain
MAQDMREQLNDKDIKNVVQEVEDNKEQEKVVNSNEQVPKNVSEKKSNDTETVETDTEIAKNTVHNARVARILNYGAIMTIGDRTGLLHNNKMGKYKRAAGLLRVGDTILVKIEEIKPDGKLSLSLNQEIQKKKIKRKKKRTKPYEFNPKAAWRTKMFGTRYNNDKDNSFEEKMKIFLKTSDEKRLDIKRSLEAKRG